MEATGTMAVALSRQAHPVNGNRSKRPLPEICQATTACVYSVVDGRQDELAPAGAEYQSIGSAHRSLIDSRRLPTVEEMIVVGLRIPRSRSLLAGEANRRWTGASSS
jgi:hypothetical protein